MSLHTERLLVREGVWEVKAEESLVRRVEDKGRIDKDGGSSEDKGNMMAAEGDKDPK